MKNKIKYQLIKLGYCFMTAMALLMATTFLYGYFCTDKIISIPMDSFGEATIELTIVLFAIPCILLAIADSKFYLDGIKKALKKEREDKI
jgi:hypothetical protein